MIIIIIQITIIPTFDIVPDKCKANSEALVKHINKKHVWGISF